MSTADSTETAMQRPDSSARVVQGKSRTRGCITIADLRRRSVIDTSTLCWHWQGAKANDGSPRIWTVDHERCDKRSMSGAKAVWNIAHGCAPRPGWLVFRTCLVTDCVNPVHISQAISKRDIGQHISRNGKRKGVNMPQRLAALVRARAAACVQPTPDHKVLAIRAAAAEVTNRALAKQLDMRETTVSEIRRGKSRCGVVPQSNNYPIQRSPERGSISIPSSRNAVSFDAMQIGELA